MFALSGYSRKRTSRPTLLNGHEWTKVAHLIVGPAIGHDFPPFVFDQGWEDGEIDPRKSGRFFASHSEVLLGTWYVLNLVAALKEKVVTGNNKKRLSKYLKDLAQEDLGEAGKAIISVDQRPCESKHLELLIMRLILTLECDRLRSIPRGIDQGDASQVRCGTASAFNADAGNGKEAAISYVREEQPRK